MIVPGRFPRRDVDTPAMTVGLVNNMAGSAAVAARRQFVALLSAVFPARTIHVRHLTCLDPAPADTLLAGHAERYDALAAGPCVPDALIVTGAEPVARLLPEEPIWRGVAWVADWAASEGVPVIWSCLAGHAAVRHLDGIERVRLPAKLSGVFASKLVRGTSRATAGLPARMPIPQSRLHGLPDHLLERRGYRILAGSDVTGADVFVREAGAPFLFLQGHPEYEADTLMREYRRDVRRYLEGARDTMPGLPHGYFEPATERALAVFGQRAAVERSAASAAELDGILRGAALSAPWEGAAARLIGGWLSRVGHAEGRARHLPQPRRSAVA